MCIVLVLRKLGMKVRMKAFNGIVFIITSSVFGVLLIPSLIAAGAEDEGTLPAGSIWFLFARFFYFLRFPTHTLLGLVFSNSGAIVYFSGLIVNCCFYGFVTERLISVIKTR